MNNTLDKGNNVSFEKFYLPHDVNHWLLPQMPEMNKRKKSDLHCTKCQRKNSLIKYFIIERKQSKWSGWLTSSTASIIQQVIPDLQSHSVTLRHTYII